LTSSRTLVTTTSSEKTQLATYVLATGRSRLWIFRRQQQHDLQLNRGFKHWNGLFDFLFGSLASYGPPGYDSSPARLAIFWAPRNLGPIFLRPAELFVGFASASTELAPPNDYDIEGRDITEDGWPLGFQLWSLTA
jgi:hypothetical protein